MGRGHNLMKLSVTDGFFWRSEIPLVTVLGPLSDPRPLPYRPPPDKDLMGLEGSSTFVASIATSHPSFV
jgi:hypothetical protein